MFEREVHIIAAGKISKIQDDVLMIKYHSDMKISRQDLIETQVAKRKLIGNECFYAILDYTEGMPGFTGEAKSFAAVCTEANENCLMDVIIIANWKVRMEVTLYKKLFQPKREMVMVGSFEEAIKIIEKAKIPPRSFVQLAG